MLFDNWKMEDRLKSMLKLQWAFIGALICLCLLFFWGWKSAPDRLTIYIPPDLNDGVVVKPNQVPDQTVANFTWTIFGSINTWLTDGTADYKDNIAAYKNYLSANFQKLLLEDYSARAGTEALDRERRVSLATLPTDDIVKDLGNGNWEVDLKVDIVETVDNSVVKDVIMLYPLTVAFVDMPITVNPYHLEITGFAVPPTLIKTNV